MDDDLAVAFALMVGALTRRMSPSHLRQAAAELETLAANDLCIPRIAEFFRTNAGALLKFADEQEAA